MVAVGESVPSRMTADEFLSWDAGDESGRIWELVDGEPVAMAPGLQNHGALRGKPVAGSPTTCARCAGGVGLSSPQGLSRASVPIAMSEFPIGCHVFAALRRIGGSGSGAAGGDLITEQ
jgi:hypothetical protein